MKTGMNFRLTGNQNGGLTPPTNHLNNGDTTKQMESKMSLKTLEILSKIGAVAAWFCALAILVFLIFAAPMLISSIYGIVYVAVLVAGVIGLAIVLVTESK